MGEDSGSHGDAALPGRAERVRGGCDVHAYFNNDIGGHAVVDAARLREMLARLL